MSEPDDLAQPQADETWAGGALPPVIYLPDQSPPEPPPPLRRNGRAVSTKPGSQISRRRRVKDPLDAWLPATRCTKAQRASADEEAERAGISLNGYVRWKIFDTPGPRVHRQASEATKLTAQVRAEMSKRGGNLNQSAKNLNIIRRLAVEGASRDRLIEMLDEMLELYRAAIAEHRATCAELERAMGLRPDDDN